jgi:hypothetical protein
MGIASGNIISAADMPKYGSSSFRGSSVARVIAHGLGVVPTSVSIIATANPQGYLGEMWVTKTSTAINVYNSGDSTVTFDWAVFK